MEVYVLKDLAKFRGLLLAQGDDGFAASRMPMQDPWWSLSFAETLAPRHGLRIVVVEHHGRVMGLAPLVRYRQGTRCFEQLGTRHLGEPSELFFDGNDAGELLVENLLRERRRIVFRRILDDCDTLKAFSHHVRSGPQIIKSCPGNYPYIDFSDVRAEVDEILGSRLRSDLRRAAKKASADGGISFSVRSPTSDEEFSELFQLLLSVEAASWKGKSGTALASDIPRQTFFRSYGLRAAKRGRLRIASLRIGDEPAAVQFAIEYANRYWLLKIGYDQRFAHCSPGNLLMYETLKHAFGTGSKSFEFLGSSDLWTDRWTLTKRKTCRVDICPTSLSKIGRVADRVSGKASRAVGVRQTASKNVNGKNAFGRTVRIGVKKLKQRASRHYISGPRAEDAMATSAFLRDLGYWVSQGYWNGSSDTPPVALASYLEAVHNLSGIPGSNTLSIKIPSLDFDPRLFGELYDRSALFGVPIHFDSLGPEDASRTLEFIKSRQKDASHSNLGCTLPGRWRRSPDDADFVVERNLVARVVKGQWLDPEYPDIDARTGFMEVVEALSGRAVCVRVATHDYELARNAIRRLRSTGTRCELELLYGLPIEPMISLALEYEVPVRIYVAFGHAYLPYAVRSLKRNPRILVKLVRDALRTNYRATIPRFPADVIMAAGVEPDSF